MINADGGLNYTEIEVKKPGKAKLFRSAKERQPTHPEIYPETVLEFEPKAYSLREQARFNYRDGIIVTADEFFRLKHNPTATRPWATTVHWEGLEFAAVEGVGKIILGQHQGSRYLLDPKSNWPLTPGFDTLEEIGPDGAIVSVDDILYALTEEPFNRVQKAPRGRYSDIKQENGVPRFVFDTRDLIISKVEPRARRTIRKKTVLPLPEKDTVSFVEVYDNLANAIIASGQKTVDERDTPNSITALLPTIEMNGLSAEVRLTESRDGTSKILVHREATADIFHAMSTQTFIELSSKSPDAVEKLMKWQGEYFQILKNADNSMVITGDISGNAVAARSNDDNFAAIFTPASRFVQEYLQTLRRTGRPSSAPTNFERLQSESNASKTFSQKLLHFIMTH